MLRVHGCTSGIFATLGLALGWGPSLIPTVPPQLPHWAGLAKVMGTVACSRTRSHYQVVRGWLLTAPGTPMSQDMTTAQMVSWTRTRDGSQHKGRLAQVAQGPLLFVPCLQLPPEINMHSLRLVVPRETCFSKLPSNPTLLHSAKGHPEVDVIRAVDPDHASL